jgi:hypothetical protein
MKYRKIASINDLGESTGILLCSNPVSIEFFVQGLDIGKLTNCTCVITDISGRVDKNVQSQYSVKISVSELSQGLYFFEILQNGHSITVLRFIKE